MIRALQTVFAFALPLSNVVCSLACLRTGLWSFKICTKRLTGCSFAYVGLFLKPHPWPQQLKDVRNRLNDLLRCLPVKTASVHASVYTQMENSFADESCVFSVSLSNLPAVTACLLNQYPQNEGQIVWHRDEIRSVHWIVHSNAHALRTAGTTCLSAHQCICSPTLLTGVFWGWLAVPTGQNQSLCRCRCHQMATETCCCDTILRSSKSASR